MSLNEKFMNHPAVKFVNGKIRNKLSVLLAVAMLLPMVVLGITMYSSAYDGLMEQAKNQLTSIRTVKANQIEDYFSQINNQIDSFSEDLMIVDAMREFPAALENVRSEKSVDESQLKTMKESLLGYYRNDFGKKYIEKTGQQPPLKDQVLPLDDDSIYLQYQYISANPNPLGSKEDLDAADDGTQYSQLHGKYHPVVRSYLQKFGYYDIFLCDIESGDIVYSVFKEMDFTTSLKTGPYSKTNFGRAFQMASQATSPGQVFLVDYEKYTPSYEDPASFISSPIFDGDELIGVAIFQMPIDRISGILGERTGLGRSGETYAIGPDNLFRNESRFLEDLGVATTIINPDVKVQTVASESALRENGEGTAIIDDYRGTPVLSSWSPVTVYEGVRGVADPITWGLMSEIDFAEVQEPISATGMVSNSIVVIVVGLFIVVGATFLLTRPITRQAETINDMLSSIGIGMFDARAEVITQDELGDVAIALNAMCDNTLSLIQSNDERESIQESIESLIGQMEGIAAGDLTTDAEVKEDITGAIAATVNHMAEQLRSIIARVQVATNEVTTSAGSIVHASNQLSEDTDAQAIEINRASDRVLEITNQIQAVATRSEDTAQVAQKARESANRGFDAVSNTVKGMDRIRQQVQATSKRIKRLGESSQEIGEIVQLISDIADRTSILALNASIQAAMAGDAGQGFAVVAEEVERLAERSTDATKQISTLIKGIQSETSEAIADMEESTREVVEGSQLASEAGETLNEINEVSRQLEELIKGVSGSALEQAGAATEIAGTMTRISETTKVSADRSRTATQSVGQLSTLANQLRESVSQFRLSEEDRADLSMIEDITAVADMVGEASQSNDSQFAPETLCRLVYTSARSVNCDEAALEDILKTARANNPTLDLTGMLLHTETRFLQVLEGPYANIMELYAKIEKDSRHIGARIRFCEKTSQRHFKNWGMGSTALSSDEIREGVAGDDGYYASLLSGDARHFTEDGVVRLRSFLSGRESANVS